MTKYFLQIITLFVFFFFSIKVYAISPPQNTDLIINSQEDWENYFSGGISDDSDVTFNGNNVDFYTSITLGDFICGWGSKKITIHSGTLTVDNFTLDQRYTIEIKEGASLIVNNSFKITNGGGKLIVDGKLEITENFEITQGNVEIKEHGYVKIGQDFIMDNGFIELNFDGGVLELIGDTKIKDGYEDKVTGEGTMIGVEGDFPNFNGVPLYALLSNFQVKSYTTEGDIQLHWTTLSEYALASFKVEGSTDGIYFKTLSEVKSNGDSDLQKEYNTEVPFYLFYRLKMVDTDQSYTYSKIITHCFGQVLATKLYPNPCRDVLYLEFSFEGKKRVEIFNLVGSKINEFETTEMKMKLDQVSSWHAGTYLVKISNEMNGGQETIRLNVSN